MGLSAFNRARRLAAEAEDNRLAAEAEAEAERLVVEGDEPEPFNAEPEPEPVVKRKPGRPKKPTTE